MSREALLARKRENSKRLRSDPEYKAREAAQNKLWRNNPTVKARKVSNQVRYERKLKFGLTETDVVNLLEAQDYKCAICKTDEPKGRGDWHVDHCHETNKVRGLLCLHCNVGLGHFKDNEEYLSSAINYLKRNK